MNQQTRPWLLLAVAIGLIASCKGNATGESAPEAATAGTQGSNTSPTGGAGSATATAGTQGGGGSATATAGANTAGSATAGGGGTAGATRVPGNPFEGAVMYVNPDFASEIDAGSGTVAAADAPLIAQAKQFPTAVWLDRIAALAGGAQNSNRLGLTQHLDAALSQAATANKPGIVLLVVYDLPNRDCHDTASNGELQGTAGLATYKSQYIDAIYQALTSKPEYQNLRIALIMEPDSLPNLVTNTSIPACATAQSSGVYVDGITYAIQKFGGLPNAYMYLDIAHSGWLGWPNNMAGAVSLYMQVLNNATNKNLAMVRGLATDISNYTPLVEPFINPNDTAILQSTFYQSNPIFDEITFVKTLSSQFAAAGWSNMGFLIDTSRSGWKQVNDGQPIDRRTNRGNWCNVNGTGLGVRPVASPPDFSQLDAYVYVKPPGESDGVSAPENATNAPDPQGKRYDPACNPNDPTLNAMANAPPAGDWFNDQFLMLLHNATPSL